MKAKVYIPIIIAAGAAAGLALGFANFGNGDKVKNDAEQTQAAQETTLSAEELAKIEEQKEKEYEEKVKEEEENAAEYFKKRQEEKEKKAEEEKKKAEEEKKKKEEEEKQKESEEETKESKENEEEQETQETKESDEPEYEYIYVPADNSYNQGNNDSGNQNPQSAPQTTQHTHSWQAVYKTVHHNAKTHDEKVRVGTTEYTECMYNGEPYFTLTTEYSDSGFYQVCKLSDGSLAYETNKENEKKEITFFMELMNISAEDEAYTFSTQVEEITDDITVTDQAAYDEQVFDHYICSGCGQTSY